MCNINIQFCVCVLYLICLNFLGEITIVSLAPLTTIAIAIALEPNFLHLVKQHVIMGSNLDSNIIEFNFGQDPESDWIVLNNTNKPSIILPIDTVQANSISKVMS